MKKTPFLVSTSIVAVGGDIFDNPASTVGIKHSAKVDLDGNGGPGVYPKDIVKSSKTKTWRTY